MKAFFMVIVWTEDRGPKTGVKSVGSCQTSLQFFNFFIPSFLISLSSVFGLPSLLRPVSHLKHAQGEDPSASSVRRRVARDPDHHFNSASI
jgi:hypothetical protein